MAHCEHLLAIATSLRRIQWRAFFKRARPLIGRLKFCDTPYPSSAGDCMVFAICRPWMCTPYSASCATSLSVTSTASTSRSAIRCRVSEGTEDHLSRPAAMVIGNSRLPCRSGPHTLQAPYTVLANTAPLFLFSTQWAQQARSSVLF